MSGSPPRILVRVDAGPAIGGGHAARCAALAEALLDEGASVVVASHELPEPIRAWFPTATTFESLASVAAETWLALVARDAPDVVVVDGYHFGRETTVFPDGAPPVVVIDDGLEPRMPCELFVNHNLYAVAGRERMLGGPAYAMLRRAVTTARRREPVRATADRVLITLGAGAQDAVLTIVDAIAEIETPLDVRVVLGPMAPDITVGVPSRHRCELRRAEPSLASSLAWSDVTVSAAGTTVLEACAIGAPLVLVVAANNQEPVAREAVRSGVARAAGPIDGAAARCCELVATLLRDHAARAEMVAR